ncbi:MAG: threonine synthase [Alphaproteobacteria bacterium]|nr:threonine synthase [Alphaproteobacteria bacterium]MBU0796121.1 threonine synthase [Alphaproteobacteria bacterium]MBU0888492.1 threonine synthase [Alphaproteobacteria bacterium]MBU1813045.1 threonine synthase [Alphaproteobacteria bacterium]
MKYVSTRGSAPILDFEQVLLAGLAEDGGLYVPQSWPQFSADELRAMRGLSYVEIARRVMTPFIGDAIAPADFARIVEDAYAGFDHKAVTPLKQLDQNFWVLELFHGPTLAFKDVALQLLGRLFDHVLTKRGERVTIVGATSGDTGSAAIEACRDRASIDIFILHPRGRTSEVQRRQMTTVLSSNVHNIALEGTFDDCQDQVKAMFNDPAFRASQRLSAVNSINWARIMAQIVYYIAAGVALGAPDRRIAFSVPTGNFGNVYAAYAAKQMGLPIEKLVVGSNRNDILTRFFNSGEMKITGVEPSLSPSMDIQVSSNFERLLFDMMDRDGRQLAETMTSFRASGSFAVGDNQLGNAKQLFEAHRIDDAQTQDIIRTIHAETGEILDPHTAVGVGAGRAVSLDPDIALIALACAHPAKFPDAVEQATGIRPALPRHLADLYEREERVTVLPNDLAALQKYVSEKTRLKGAA